MYVCATETIIISVDFYFLVDTIIHIKNNNKQVSSIDVI